MGAPVVDEDVLEERGLGCWVVERGQTFVGHEGGCDEMRKLLAHLVERCDDTYRRWYPWFEGIVLGIKTVDSVTAECEGFSAAL